MFDGYGLSQSSKPGDTDFRTGWASTHQMPETSAVSAFLSSPVGENG